MTEAGVQVLGPDELGDPTATAWTEAGEIDQRGHDLGLRLAHEIDDQVERIARRIRELLDAGWQTVTIVTDHGWLLLPGGLPKNEGLPVAATAHEEGAMRAGQGRRRTDRADRAVALGPGRADRGRAGHLVLRGEPDLRARWRQPAGVRRPAAHASPPTARPHRLAAEITRHDGAGSRSWSSSRSSPTARRSTCGLSAGDPDVEHRRARSGHRRPGKVMLLVEDEDLEGTRGPARRRRRRTGRCSCHRQTTVGQNR